MPVFSCPICNKGFNRKSNFDYHMKDKIRPCSTLNSNFPPIPSDFPPIPSNPPPIPSNPPPISSNNSIISSNNSIISSNNSIIFSNKSKSVIDNKEVTINDLILKKINDMVNPNLDNLDTNTCIYCNSVFTRFDNLQRHQRIRCKSKKNYDELEKLKEKLILITSNYTTLEKEIEVLKKEKDLFKNIPLNTTQITNNTTNNTKNQINNGVINNNNVNVQLVQFGCENIDNIDSDEALNVYFRSTGGNILSNVLKLINLNEKYPQNHNICISDLSRELVKIFNGKKFVVKKFKNVEGEIMGKVIKNTYKIVDKIENDDSIILTANILSKLRINKISLGLLNGSLPEDIVRDEIREKEKLLKKEDLKEDLKDDNDSKKEREFNLEERLRIEHLQSKQQGLIDISLERLKDELYNGKDLIENSEKIVKCKKKKYVIIP
jgi:hypothetical protein